MPALRFACALVALTLGFAIVTAAQTERAFPTNEEIGLLLTQADRGVEGYKTLLDEQETQIGKSVANDIAKDREALSALELVFKGLKNRRQAFNGTQGLIFMQSLHDVDRSLLRCVNTASSDSSGYLIAGNRDKAASLLHLSQSCMDLSMLIYTIIENTGSLYKRFIEAEDQWAAHSTQEARQCQDAMEKNKPKKFAPVF